MCGWWNNQKISIVVLNYNNYQDTLECLSSLSGLDYENYEVIVVDNASNDDSYLRLKSEFPEHVLLKSPYNLGFAGGNNIGIMQALSNGADYILLLNNDTVIGDKKLLHKLISFAGNKSNIGLISPLVLYYNTEKIWFAGGKINSLTGFCRHIKKGRSKNVIRRACPYYVDYLSGCFLLVKREVFEKIGLLDEVYFLYYEDVDLCCRAKKVGYSCCLFPDTWVYHKKSATAGLVGKNKLSELQSYYFSRNALIFAKKNLKGWRRITFIMAQFTIRFLYNLILVSSLKSARNYFRGLYEGIKWSNINL